MKGFYQITDKLKEVLESNGFVTVTMGDIEKVDVRKQSIFPLAHIVPAQVVTDKTIAYSFAIVGMDLVDFNKNDNTDPFHGIDNTQDVLHSILFNLQKTIEEFKRGDAFTELYQVTGGQTYDPFTRRFENVVAGWLVDLTIEVPNYSSVC